MGKLIYAAMTDHPLTIDDAVLAHLQLVISAKLRRREGFFLTVVEPVDVGSGRTTIWLSSPIDLRFKYGSNRTVRIDRTWLEELSVAANSANGLGVIPSDSDRLVDRKHDIAT